MKVGDLVLIDNCFGLHDINGRCGIILSKSNNYGQYDIFVSGLNKVFVLVEEYFEVIHESR